MAKENKKNKKPKAKYLAAAVLIIFVLGIIIYYSFFRPTTTFGKHVPVLLTPENLPAYLENLNIVEDVPKKADIQLNFGDMKYNIKGADVTSGKSNNPDITISLPEPYINKIGEEGVCNALSEAIQKNEIKIETSLSNAELLWKYKGLLKYKECISG